MLEFIPWIPTSCDSCLHPRSRGAAEPGQWRRWENKNKPDFTPNLQILFSHWTLWTVLKLACCDPGADPYVIISCEGRSVKSTIKHDTLQPEFTTSGVFYRKKPRKPITVEVSNHSISLVTILRRLQCFWNTQFYPERLPLLIFPHVTVVKATMRIIIASWSLNWIT